jgi:hypothetical protein
MNDSDPSSSRLSVAPQLALEKVAFPSDKLTLGDLRRAHRPEFDTLGVNFFDGAKMGRAAEDWPQSDLAEMLHIERQIAQRTFEASFQGYKGASVLTSADKGDRQYVNALSGHYIRYGLARGKHEAKTLIGSILSQALQEATILRNMAGISR